MAARPSRRKRLCSSVCPAAPGTVAAIAGVEVKFRGSFAYVSGRLPNDETQPLVRLRYGGYADSWGFAVYLASKNGYEPSALPDGQLVGLPENAMDLNHRRTYEPDH